ncbi:MAG TPA: hypothetical protein VGG33_04720 [Polyangia bacterium]
MSTVIGKGTTSAPDADAIRQDTERRNQAADAATRSAKFRAALGGPGDGSSGPTRFGLEKRGRGSEGPGSKGKTEGASSKPSGNTERSAAAGRDAAEGRTDKPMRPAGLTDEQAMVLGAAGLLGGEGGAPATGKKPGQGMGAASGADDGLGAGLATAGPGSVSAKPGKAGSPGEELIAEVAAAVSAAAQVSPGQGWSRPEGPTRPDRPVRELPQPLPGVDPVHQLLIGKGPNGAEARMRISVGPLAGTEIHLREGPGGIQAAIITQTASSRQTLSSAMEAVAQRLKDKGHKLDVRIDGRSAQAARSPETAQSTEGSRTADSASAFDDGQSHRR